MLPASSPFGTPTRTAILLQLHVHGRAHVRQLARLLGVPLSVVQHGLATLEGDGLVARQREGRLCHVFLSPSYVARAELCDYLRRLAELRQGQAESAASPARN